MEKINACQRFIKYHQQGNQQDDKAGSKGFRRGQSLNRNFVNGRLRLPNEI